MPVSSREERRGWFKGVEKVLVAMRVLALITARGAGNATPLAAGLSDSRVDAVVTAHLFNFVRDGLKQARQALISGRVNLSLWDIQLLEQNLGAEKACEARLD